MKRIPLSLACAACFLLMGRPCPAETFVSKNLVRNGGFETGKTFPAGWKWAKWSQAPSAATIRFTSDSHGGRRAVQLTGLKNISENRDARYLLYSRPIRIHKGMYDLNLWCKTTGDATAAVFIHYYDHEPKADRWDAKSLDMTPYSVGAAKTWTRFHRRVNPPKKAKYLVLLLRGYGTGNVFFDDVSLVRQRRPVAASVYPAQFGRASRVCCFAGLYTPVYFEFTGDSSGAKAPARLLVDVPKSVQAACIDPMTITENRNRRILSVDISRAMKTLRPTIGGAGIVLWLQAPFTVDGDHLHYRVVYDGRKPPSRKLTLRVFKGYDGAALSAKDFRFSFIWSLLHDAPESIRPDVYKLLRTSGINVFTTRAVPYEKLSPLYRYLEKEFREDGGLVVASVPSSYCRRQPYGNPKRPRSGAQANWASRIIEMGEKAFAQMDTGTLASCKDRIDAYYWDFEPRNEREHPNLDDPLTLKQFAKWSGRDESVVNEAYIREHCLEEFMTFRAWQIGEVIRMFERWVHSIAPDMEVWIAAGRELPTVRFVDFRLYDDADVYHLPMLYCNSVVNYHKMLRDDIRRVPRGEDVFMPTITNQGDRSHGKYINYSPANMRLRFLATAALGCRGLGHWPDLHRGVDGEYLAEYSRAAWETAAMIDVWKKGKRIDSLFTIEGLPYRMQTIKTKNKTIHEKRPAWGKYLLTFAHQGQDGMYVTVLNTYEKEDAFIEIKADGLAPMRYYVTDPVYKKRIVPGKEQSFWLASQLAKGILINVPAEGAGYVCISTEAPSKEYQEVVNCNQLRREYEKRVKTGSPEENSVIEKDGMRIEFDDVDGDGVIERCVTTPSQTVWIDRNGTMIAWRVHGRKNLLVKTGGAQSAGEDRFWLPKDVFGKTVTAEGEFLSVSMDKGVAKLTVKRRFSHPALAGVVLTKHFTIFADRPAVEVTVNICNRDGLVPIELGYWSANFLGIGQPHANWRYPGRDGVTEFDKHKKRRSLYTHPEKLDETLLKHVEKTSLPPICGNWCETVDPDNGEKVQLRVDPEALLQLYQWNHKNGMHTVEWMAKPVLLPVGKTWTTFYVLEYHPLKKQAVK